MGRFHFVLASAMVCAFAAAAGAQEPVKIEPVKIGPFAEKHVWPLSGTEKQDGPFSGAFGPRQLASESYRHDFHRAIDIRCVKGTPVHAIADGVVRTAGKTTTYLQPMVSLRHYRPDAGNKCGDVGCYYSNYIHLNDVTVKEGDVVKAGDLIGHSGESKDDFECLHFEIRDGGTLQRDAIHPLAVLPYADKGPPTVTIDGVQVGRTMTTVIVTASTPPDEIDLLRVEMTMFDGTKEIVSKSYDLHEWNRAFTPEVKGKEAAKVLDEQLVNHVRAEPGRFRADASRYDLTLVFEDLPVVTAANKAKLVVRAKAFDLRGNASKEAERKGVK